MVTVRPGLLSIMSNSNSARSCSRRLPPPRTHAAQRRAACTAYKLNAQQARAGGRLPVLVANKPCASGPERHPQHLTPRLQVSLPAASRLQVSLCAASKCHCVPPP
eukprot:1349072-Rhodomonas_salina.1